MIVFTIDDRSGGSYDTTIFNYNPATLTFTAYTNDLSKASVTYDMRILANFDGYS